MDMKEKLVELLRNMPVPEITVFGQRCGKALVTAEFIADHLIANGFGFVKDNNVPSKWIPVTERLPQEGDVVLVYDKYRCLYIGRYLYDTVFNAVGRNFNTSAVAWMPLPELPKEGEHNA